MSDKKIMSIAVSKRVAIVFETGEKISISHENYLQSGYLFPGKTIGEKAYAKLLEYDNEEEFRNYLERLLKTGEHSAFELASRLSAKKGLEPARARKLVESLKREGKLDEREAARSKIAALRLSGWSPARIRERLIYEMCFPASLVASLDEEIEDSAPEVIDELIRRGLNKNPESFLSSRCAAAQRILFGRGYSTSSAQALVEDYLQRHEELLRDDQEMGDERVEKLVERYFVRYQSYAPAKRFEAVIAHLCKDGLSREEARRCAERYLENSSESLDWAGFKRDGERIVALLARRPLSKDEKRSLFVRKLLALGYNYKDIEELIQEVGYEFD